MTPANKPGAHQSKKMAGIRKDAGHFL